MQTNSSAAIVIVAYKPKPGKQADLLIHEVHDYRELAYFIAAPAHPRVFIGGREITV